MQQKFIYDDLHIAINREANTEAYDTWSNLDAIVTTIIMLLTCSGCIASKRYDLLGIILVATFLFVKLLHYLLQRDYEKNDIRLAGIYARRVFDDFYDADWFQKYQKAESDENEEQIRYVDLYYYGINRVLAGHLFLAMIGLLLSFLLNAEPTWGFIANMMHICQSVLCFRFLISTLNHSFLNAYVNELKGPRE